MLVAPEVAGGEYLVNAIWLGGETSCSAVVAPATKG
jgi:hypothetical protein